MNPQVSCGSWLCEKAKTLERNRTSYSSETDLALKLASDFNLDDELKNVILAVFRSFAFLHNRVKMRRTQGEQIQLLCPTKRILMSRVATSLKDHFLPLRPSSWKVLSGLRDHNPIVLAFLPNRPNGSWICRIADLATIPLRKWSKKIIKVAQTA